MWDEIEKKGARYQELAALIESPEGPGNPNYSAWLRERGRMSKFGTLWDEFASARKAAKEAQELLNDPSGDADLKTLAKEEFDLASARQEAARQKLVDMALNEDDDSSRNVIIELHAGTGGDEAALFVADLYDMYQHYAENNGLKLSVLESAPGNVGGFKELVLRAEGEGAFGKFRYEGGGHRVQRVPKTETQGRVHTSMARVAVLPEAEEVDVQIDPKEVRESFCAAGGPGGQNVNKVASQCQLVHIPSGIIVHCMETRSAMQNKVRAWQILRSKLYALKKAEIENARSDQRLGQIGSGDRSERIRTYNYPQGRLTDHRIEGDDKNWSIQESVGGRLEPLVAKLEEIRRSAGKVAAQN